MFFVILRFWMELEELMRKVDPNLSLSHKYGFYSSHTVCLPTFFSNHETSRAWGYSLFMVILNFSAFIFIAIGYFLMFR